jgi:hypothetical protein
MNTEKMMKESKVIFLISLTVGSVLLLTGIVLLQLGAELTPNDKAFIGLSFIPFGLSFSYFIKYSRIRKSPQSIRKTMLPEIDERLVSIRNEADAKALKVMQGVMFLTYMGYTLIVPGDVFESPAWWILLALLFLSFLSQGILQKIVAGKDRSLEEEN